MSNYITTIKVGKLGFYAGGDYFMDEDLPKVISETRGKSLLRVRPKNHLTSTHRIAEIKKAIHTNGGEMTR